MSGSAIAISHGTDQQPDPELAEQMRALQAAYAESATPVTWREPDVLYEALNGLDLVPPGLVDLVDWPVAGQSTQKSLGNGAVALVP